MLVVAALVAATAASAQWQFELDTTFRTVVTRLAVASVLPQVDGSVIASGPMRFPGEMNDKLLVKFLPNGARDEAFNNSGLGRGKLTAWQDRFYVGTAATVRRILYSGLQDPTFIGMNTGPYFNSLQGGDYHVYPDGRVLMSGAHMLRDSIRGFVGIYNLIWFTNTGYLDTTKVHRTGNNVVYRFKELPDGKFICSGTCTEFEGEEVDWIFRVHADGSTDTTFRTGVFWGGARGYLPLADGRCYVAGNFRRNQAPDDTLRVVRFMPDGSLDPSFSIPHFALNGLYNHGLGVSPSGFGPGMESITPWEGGRLIVTGYFGSVNGVPRGGICMLDSTGAVLEAFDGCWASPFIYQNTSYGGIMGFTPAGDGEHYYIHGSYKGFDDGTVNDTLQRFVSRLRVVEDFTTGVASLSPEEEPGVRVYPNPARGTVMFTYDDPLLSGQQGRIVVRDLSGRVVATLAINGTSGRHTWDVQGVAPGTYVVQYLAGNTVLHTERLIIQH
jgi:uncharacterized delta-60 repeat protein